MALCNSCAAPLSVNTSLCSYCGTRNDLDVLAMQRFDASRETSRLPCPHCQLPMETIRLSSNGAFAVERCPTCFGLFFDPGEVQSFLHSAMEPTFLINRQEISNINNQRARTDLPVRYIKCPECDKFMNRVNFGATSGVVVDQCKEHGVWLDNGELIHLMEWKRAGGQLRPEQKPHNPTIAPQIRPSLPRDSAEETLADPIDELLNSTAKLLTRLFG
ncbi:MAG: hypothetical protein A2091_03915 [Desulfuromonadales bacterium GWD2_61_12]|nr:MAG: hypothetical protein A2091_03915 [Desulfuromonadales bacterium GWD2_61_12]HAD05047.1 hypothetical protein [Desulfuromonas sp.]HBT82820.1 hypothetical protein [Desulfuromonas sp.]